MRRLVATVVLGLPATVWATTAELQPVEITAFGDTAYIGGNGLHGEPARGYVRDRLGGVEELRSADLNFINLEASLARRCSRYAKKPYRFSMGPSALMQMVDWGFNLIGLANNHTIDCLNPYPGRESPFLQNWAAKRKPALAMHGVARDLTSLVNDVPVITIRGVRIGFVSLKAWANGRHLPLANLDNRDRVFASLAKARVDVRILSLHGGDENSRTPNTVMRSVAREFIAKYNGDIVFGHHSHTMQGYELVASPSGRTGAIFYSLGNFLHNGLSKKGDGLSIRLTVDHHGLTNAPIQIIPLRNASHLPQPGGQIEIAKLKRILRQNHSLLRQQNWSPGYRWLEPVETVVETPSPRFLVSWPTKPAAMPARTRTKIRQRVSR